MTPSCSCHSSPPSSMKIFLACKLLLVPLLTGWLQTSSASTVLKLNFCYLVSNPNWTKFTIQHLPSLSNGASVCPSMASGINISSQLLISLIRIVDISISNYWYQQFELLISVIGITDINNSRKMLISTIRIADINNCTHTFKIWITLDSTFCLHIHCSCRGNYRAVLVRSVKMEVATC